MASGNIMVGGSLGTAPMSNAPQTPTVSDRGDSTLGATFQVVDGTPARVVTLIILVVAGLAGLRWAGYKFNIVSG